MEGRSAIHTKRLIGHAINAARIATNAPDFPLVRASKNIQTKLPKNNSNDPRANDMKRSSCMVCMSNVQGDSRAIARSVHRVVRLIDFKYDSQSSRSRENILS